MKRNHLYENLAQQRVLRTMLVLFGHEIEGMSPSQIAKAVGTSMSNVTRDIYNLTESGVAERLPHNNNVRITPRMGQKALAILNNIDSVTRRVDETRNRYTREA